MSAIKGFAKGGQQAAGGGAFLFSEAQQSPLPAASSATCAHQKKHLFAGAVIETRFHEPQLWADCSLPETVVEPLLPPYASRQPDWAPAAASQTQPAAVAPPVGSREAHLVRGWLSDASSGLAPGNEPPPAGHPSSSASAPAGQQLSTLDAAALRQRVEARAPTSDSWRGFSVSMPFLPGGDSVDPKASATAAAVAAEAEGGGWLRRLERDDGRAPGRVAAPGLPRGAFGAWALPEEEAVLCELTLFGGD